MKKTIASLLVLAAIAFSASAGIQIGISPTNVVAGSTATNFVPVAPVMSAVNSSDLTLQVWTQSPSANTSNVTWMFNVSVDNVNWQTNAFTFTYAAQGAVISGVCTNLLAGQKYPFYQLSYVSNASASVTITNLSCKLFTKPGI